MHGNAVINTAAVNAPSFISLVSCRELLRSIRRRLSQRRSVQSALFASLDVSRAWRFLLCSVVCVNHNKDSRWTSCFDIDSDTKILKLLFSPVHCLHSLLPAVKSNPYGLRSVDHNFQLPICNSFSRKSFIIRSLFRFK